MSELRVEDTPEGALIRVIVVPDAGREAIEVEAGDLVIYTTEPEIWGRTNSVVRKVLSRATGARTQSIEIVHGVRKRRKTVLVRGLSSDVVKARLLAALRERRGEGRAL